MQERFWQTLLKKNKDSKVYKEVLEQVKRSADTDCGPQTMRRAYIAMKHGNWESSEEEDRKEVSFVNVLLKEFKKRMRKWQWMTSAAWALHEKSPEKHGLLAADHLASRRNGRSHFVVCLPALQLFPSG